MQNFQQNQLIYPNDLFWSQNDPSISQVLREIIVSKTVMFLYFFAYAEINRIECASEAKKMSMLRPKNGKTKGKNCVT